MYSVSAFLDPPNGQLNPLLLRCAGNAMRLAGDISTNTSVSTASVGRELGLSVLVEPFSVADESPAGLSTDMWL